RTRQKTVYFLTGHGERAPEDFFRFGYNKAKLALQDVNYAIRDTLLLARVHQVPDDCDLLVVAGPKTLLFPAEIDSIESYLAAGGAGFFLLDPEVETGLAPMLAKWNIGVNNDYVVDGSGVGKLFGLDYTMPVAAEYATHPVTEKHKGLMTFFRHARSITRLADSAEMQVVELVKTSPASWRETTLGNEKPRFDNGKDVRGPVSLAVAVKAKPGRPRVWGNDAGVRFTQIVVFGDSDFASNQFFDVQGNGDLFLNAVGWLLEEGDLIAIRPKERSIRRVDLTLSDVRWIRWLSMVILPAIPIFIGIVVWWRRR
ncbi:MAG: Gldg family protein, partial [bacterium]|nr:Gldg family protein [bacterium]